jgi:hypothetical protein
MPLATEPFDPAAYLDSEAAMTAYLNEALATGDAAFVADALDVVARARRRTGQGPALAPAGEEIRLARVFDALREAGLRLQAVPAGSP